MNFFVCEKNPKFKVLVTPFWQGKLFFSVWGPTMKIESVEFSFAKFGGVCRLTIDKWAWMVIKSHSSTGCQLWSGSMVSFCQRWSWILVNNNQGIRLSSFDLIDKGIDFFFFFIWSDKKVTSSKELNFDWNNWRKSSTLASSMTRVSLLWSWQIGSRSEPIEMEGASESRFSWITLVWSTLRTEAQGLPSGRCLSDVVAWTASIQQIWPFPTARSCSGNAESWARKMVNLSFPS